MTESVSQDTASTPAPATATPKKKKTATTPKAKTVSKKAPASHPPTSSMVNNAIKSLNERGGSSLQAIKKFISSTYKLDAEKLAPFIKKYLKSAVDNGTLVRTKGKGAAGSFKLAGTKTKAKAEPTKKKVVTPKKKKPVEKKEVKPKKTKAASPKKAAPKKAPAKPKAVKPKPAPKPKKSPSKAKKPAKAPAAKAAKSPKPKKTTAPKKTVKKTASKK